MPKSRPTKRIKVGVKRPIDKRIVIINQNMTAATQTQIGLYPTGGAGATFPGTITGLRWKIMINSTSTTVIPNVTWAIIKLRDGNTPTALSLTSGASAYNPEQDVMCNGWMTVDSDNVGANNYSVHTPDMGHTKTMRKLMAGDNLTFIAATNFTPAAGTVLNISGFVEFFFKS